MKLSRLEIYGFKSFAKKFNVRLTGGITAVVGPNGCGKTNVVDAIRWVLGEQRPTLMRLERMEDILFKGSSKRHPLGMSEVTLTVDNDAGVLPVDMSEVTVTRRLFRSGESEYMINKKPCRLADISDLFMDTGIGTDSYSLFEVSMINAILSNKTDDRRRIFEEAAGITKYKTRRKSAMNKLISIEDDLARVGDIISELQRRVDLLKRQASRASRYRRLKSELKSKTIALAAWEMEKQKKNTADVKSQLVSLQSSLESVRAKIARQTADSERLSVDIVTVEKELEQTAILFENSIGSISEKEKEFARLDSRLESLGEITARARETAHRNSSELENLAVDHRNCAGNLSEVKERLEKLERSYGKKVEQYHVLNDKVTEKSAAYADIEKEYRRIEQDIASRKSSLSHENSKQEENEKRLRDISEHEQDLRQSRVSLNEDLEWIEEQKKFCVEWKHETTQGLSDVNNTLCNTLEAKEFIDEKLRNEHGKLTALKAERDFLYEVVRSYEGYSEGVKNALQSESIKGRTSGVLADLISADDRYVPAVEAALRESLNHIVVETTGDALAGVRYLSEEARGRASFIPLDRTKSTSVKNPVPHSSGIIGPAHEFIRADKRFMPVIRRLLEKTIIVDSLMTGLDLHWKHDDFTFVTLKGEIVGSFGEIHGGHSEKNEEQSSIGRLKKLDKLTSMLKKAGHEVSILQKERDELNKYADSLRSSAREKENTREQLRENSVKLESTEAKILAKIDAVQESLTHFSEETSKIKESTENLETNSQNITADLEKSKNILRSLKERLEQTESELDKLKTEHERYRSEVNAYEVERAKLTEKKASLTREIKTLEERKETLTQSSKFTLREIENANSESTEARETQKKLVNELETLGQNHESLKTGKEEIERRYADMRSERSDKERKIQTMRRELDELTRKESSLILARDEAAMIIKNIIARLSEEYFIEPDNIPCVDNEPGFDPEQEKLLLENIRREIHSLGDVNLAAEKDFKEEKERLDFLKHERDDLLEASKTLQETITKINNIARSRFTETFELIRVNFQKMFQNFFDGGTCSLDLEKDVDPLESDILISAQPPGKNIRSINLLSSGERALTAISLLFALYLVKPSPFCILDEVDAPLDDTNLDRYLKVIREFSKKTQFIMVTHNKKSMAEADNLYGITMEEPGLSTLVSVQLSEVDTGGSGGGNQEKQEEAVMAGK